MNQKNYLYLLIFNLLCTFVRAQSSGGAAIDYSTHKVESVTFHKPNDIPDNWIRFYKDPTANTDPNVVVNPLEYVSPDANKTVAYTTSDQQPVAYVSGCKGVVSAEFTSNCEGRSFYVRGQGIDGFNLKPQLVKVTNGKFSYPKTEFSGLAAPYTTKKFEDLKVRHFPNFTIKWAISDKETGIYKQIGESNNPLYVTHKKPINTQVIHSFLFISCKSANNKNTEDDVMSTIYDDFTDQCVKKYNGSKCMGYWADPLPSQKSGSPALGLCFTGIALIAWENATCGAWADLHVELVKAQGLNYVKDVGVVWEDDEQLTTPSSNLMENNFITFFGDLTGLQYYKDSNGNDDKAADFYVNNYNFNNGLQTFYLAETSNLTTAIINNHLLTKANTIGSKGQGNIDPRSYFENHAITKNIKTGKYYDPSYGTVAPFNGPLDWQNQSLAGFGTRLRYKEVLSSGLIKFYNLSWVGYNLTQQTVKFY